MKREEYFTFLQETSNSVSPILEKYVESFFEADKELYDILMLFIKKRLHKPLLKPALLRLSYEICGGKDWEKVIPVAAAFELINISSYQANSAFDNKLGVLTKPEKDSQFIAAMITREMAAKIASELEKDFDKHMINEVYDSLSKSNYYIYLAQHYDLNLLSIKNYEEYLDEEIFLKEYFNRCFYGSGIFNGQCAYIGALLANGQPAQLEALRTFGENYGTSLQIVNDIGDYIPSGIDSMINRSFQDQYSDFRNSRLTLPLYHLLRFGNSMKVAKIMNVINEQINDKKILFDITNCLVEEGSISYAKKKAREYIKKAETNIQIFEKNNHHKKLLLIMGSMILTNKYFVAFRRIANSHFKPITKLIQVKSEC